MITYKTVHPPQPPALPPLLPLLLPLPPQRRLHNAKTLLLAKPTPAPPTYLGGELDKAFRGMMLEGAWGSGVASGPQETEVARCATLALHTVG